MSDGVLSEEALRILRDDNRLKAVAPIVQRYELDVRIDRMEQVLADLRLEFQRCRVASAGIEADHVELMRHCAGIKGHLAHLQALRAAL